MVRSRCACAALFAFAACTSPDALDGRAREQATESVTADSARAPSAEPRVETKPQAPLGSSSVGPTAPAPMTSGPCPNDMRWVAGLYCPVVSQECLRWNEVAVGGRTVRNQCAEYRAPSRCLSKERRALSFCMDTFEWPNRRGEIPHNLVSWQEASDQCQAIGKRLCDEDEFNFACEGLAMNPHVTGHLRDPSKCSYDRPYRERVFNFLKREACAADGECAKALAAIDQRVASGAMPECVSEFGVYDLNGNVNEWVTRPGKGFSKRAGLKGGWWGPVRDRCRPITTFHGESDFGYEVGFRCCKDAGPSAP